MKSNVATIILVLLGCMILFSGFRAYGTISSQVIVVKDKEVKTYKDGDSIKSKYLIFTNNGVFENTDTLWHWKWNSSDIYNQLDRKYTYEITTYGWRVPFMSWYKNIIDVKPYNQE